MTAGSDRFPVERRRHARLKKTLPVHVRLDRQAERHTAAILNIGAGGVLLQTDLDMTTNDLLTIELDLAGESQPISVYGTVVRSDARGIGVAFVRISEITSELIAYLIRKWEREGAPQG
jgi:PilZ domain